MKKHTISLSLILLFGFVVTVSALPSSNYQQNILPFQNNTYDLGSTSPNNVWKNVFTLNLTTSSTTSWGAIQAPYFTATSTTATSTFKGLEDVFGNLVVGGFNSASTFTATSTTASSTLKNFSFTNGQGTSISLSSDASFVTLSSSGLATLNGLTITGTGTSTTVNNNLLVKGNAQVLGNLFAPINFVSGVTNVTVLNATSTTATSTFSGGLTAGNNIAFTVNQGASANALYINNSGKIGVNTASPRAVALDINGVTYLNRPATKSDANGGAADFGGEVDFTNTDFAANKNSYLRVTYPDTSTIRFGSDYDGSVAGTVYRDIQFGRTITPYVTIKNDTTGNVGIGTTTPEAKLDVNGSGRFVDNSGVALQLYGASDTTNNKWQFRIRDVAQGDFAIYDEAQSLDRLYISKAGNVGIGTTAPIGKLQLGSNWTANPGGTNTIYLGSTGFVNVSLAPEAIITTSSANTTPGANIGLALHNTDTTAGGYAPLLVFSKRESGATAYNSGIAAIGARTVTGSGAGDSYIDGELMFYTAPTAGSGLLERMRISENGNVGIGTTNPTAQLTVGNISTQFGTFLWNINSTSGYTASTTIDDVGLSFGHNSAARDIEFKTNGTPRLTILGGGNVGIGTTSPTRLLSVSDDGTYSAYFSKRVGIGTNAPAQQLEIAATADPFIKFNNTTASKIGYIGISNSANNFITSDAQGDMDILVNSGKINFSTNNGTNNVLTIATNGNVGIGTTSPWRTFSVTGTMAAPTLSAEGATGNAVCQVTGGEITSNAAATCTVSSRRYKHDIKTLSAGLDELMKYRPVSYLSNITNEPNVGLIAEEVQKIDPRLITLNKEGLPQAVKYENLTAKIIGWLQDLVARITGLEERLNKDEAKIRALENKLK